MTKTGLACLLSLCLMVSGCSSARMIAVHDAPTALRKGDRVNLVMKSGETWKLHLEQVDAGTLTGRKLRTGGGGERVQVALAEVQTLERRQFSPARTTGMVAGVLVALLGGLYVALLEAHEDDE